MARKYQFIVTFTDGTTVEVTAKSQRMAKAKGSVKARKSPGDIERCSKVTTRYDRRQQAQEQRRSRRRWHDDDWDIARLFR